MSIDPLQQSVQSLKGVGPARAELLDRLGIKTVRDLLFHFPRGYEDLTDVRPIASLTAGTTQTVQGEVVEIDGKRSADGKAVVSIVISDGKDILEGVWFNQTYLSSRFRYGQRVAFSGKPKRYRNHWQMTSPRVQPLDRQAAESSPGVLPIYPLTEELRADDLRKTIRQAVEEFAGHVSESLPASVLQVRGLPILPKALHQLHLPLSQEEGHTARKRFIYEEFFLLQLALAIRRRELRDRLRAPILVTTPHIDAHIRRLFPFTLTADQDKAVSQICRDLAGQRPMQRLLQADVGAGKTAVAVYALLVAVANKHQAVLMAPTEVLAQQHWRTIGEFLEKSRVRRLLLTGSLTAKERRQALVDIAAGKFDLVVGTQALVQNELQFPRLGLVVVDEQHKFGVQQRAQVRRLGGEPHYLVMTATPIPRTVGLTLFGDLDVSRIRQLPPGRQPVATRWVVPARRDRVYEDLRQGLRQGRQAYVVCPLVAESETLDLKAAVQTYAELQGGPFRGFRLGLLHGGMADDVKDETMERFRRREIDLLVCTSVIEVGVDVPNATLMVVEHAERFGLSQLHQLRGRVSRGETAGQCYLFADPAGEDARQRLRAFTRTTDGFALAELDLKLRGLGEFFGTRQHGLGELRVGDLIDDAELLQHARHDAIHLVLADPGLRRLEHAAVRRIVLERYGQTLDLPAIG